MNKKSKLILSLIVALIVLIAVLFLWQNPLNHNLGQETTQKILTASLDNLQKIEIIKDGKTTILEKQEDKWVVASENYAEANTEYVDKLINNLKTIEKGEIISQNPEKFINFELAEGMGTLIKLSDNQNNVLLELQVGKTGPAYTQCYVKKPNSNNVLLINKNLLLSLTPTSWVKPIETNNQNTNINSSN